MPDFNLLPPGGRRQSERAHSFSLHICGGCPHLHVALKDAEGNIFADFVMSALQLEGFIQAGRAKIQEARALNVRRQNDE
jgi:hypothetical protein